MSDGEEIYYLMQCPNCAVDVEYPAELAGTENTCASCNTTILLQAPEEEQLVEEQAVEEEPVEEFEIVQEEPEPIPQPAPVFTPAPRPMPANLPMLPMMATMALPVMPRQPGQMPVPVVPVAAIVSSAPARPALPTLPPFPGGPAPRPALPMIPSIVSQPASQPVPRPQLDMPTRAPVSMPAAVQPALASPAPKLPTLPMMPVPVVPISMAVSVAPPAPDEAQMEAARVEAAKVEAARVEAAKVEAAKVEAARVEAAKVEAARVEAARVEAARVEAARVEAARVEAAKAANVLVDYPALKAELDALLKKRESRREAEEEAARKSYEAEEARALVELRRRDELHATGLTHGAVREKFEEACRELADLIAAEESRKAKMDAEIKSRTESKERDDARLNGQIREKENERLSLASNVPKLEEEVTRIRLEEAGSRKQFEEKLAALNRQRQLEEAEHNEKLIKLETLGAKTSSTIRRLAEEGEKLFGQYKEWRQQQESEECERSRVWKQDASRHQVELAAKKARQENLERDLNELVESLAKASEEDRIRKYLAVEAARRKQAAEVDVREIDLKQAEKTAKIIAEAKREIAMRGKGDAPDIESSAPALFPPKPAAIVLEAPMAFKFVLPTAPQPAQPAIINPAPVAEIKPEKPVDLSAPVRVFPQPVVSTPPPPRPAPVLPPMPSAMEFKPVDVSAPVRVSPVAIAPATPPLPKPPLPPLPAAVAKPPLPLPPLPPTGGIQRPLPPSLPKPPGAAMPALPLPPVGGVDPQELEKKALENRLRRAADQRASTLAGESAGTAPGVLPPLPKPPGAGVPPALPRPFGAGSGPALPSLPRPSGMPPGRPPLPLPGKSLEDEARDQTRNQERQSS